MKTSAHAANWRRRRLLIEGIAIAILAPVSACIVVTADYKTRYSLGFDLIGLLLFMIAGGVIVTLPFWNWRGRGFALLALAIVYSGSYCALSAGGRYCWSQSGKMRWHGGMAVTDVAIWQPKWLYGEPFVNIYGSSRWRGTMLGYFYMPLLRCDQKWVHPTRDFFAENESPLPARDLADGNPRSTSVPLAFCEQDD